MHALCVLLVIQTYGSYVGEFLVAETAVHPNKGFCASTTGLLLVYGSTQVQLFDTLGSPLWKTDIWGVAGCSWRGDTVAFISNSRSAEKTVCNLWSINAHDLDLRSEAQLRIACIGVVVTQDNVALQLENWHSYTYTGRKSSLGSVFAIHSDSCLQGYNGHMPSEQFRYGNYVTVTLNQSLSLRHGTLCATNSLGTIVWYADGDTYIGDRTHKGMARSLVYMPTEHAIAILNIDGDKVTLVDELRVDEEVLEFPTPEVVLQLASSQEILYGLTSKSVVVFKTQNDLHKYAVALALSSTPRRAGTTLLFVLPCELHYRNTKVAIGSKLPRVIHPTQWVVLESESAGIVVGNMFLCSVLLGVYCVAIFGLSTLKAFEGTDVRGVLRYPFVPYFLFHFFLQGTTLGFFGLLFQPTSTLTAMVGMAGLLGSLFVVFVIHLRVVDTVTSKRMVCFEDSAMAGSMMQLLMGRGEWVSTEEDSQVVQRYGSLFKLYKPSCYWFYLFDVLIIMVLGAFHKLKPDTYYACGHPKAASACVVLLFVVLLVVLQPHNRYQDLVFDVVIWSAQTMALAAKAMHYYTAKSYTDDTQADGIANMFFVCMANMCIARTVIDLVLGLYTYLSGRANRIQKYVWVNYQPVICRVVPCEVEPCTVVIYDPASECAD